ncbi:MAG TPA: ABC transporter substrate-binding protein [Pseudonocardiaceae bacterium]|nr:ABC transporter substrate-binding protein [Pseudonocardiaceae bacterium]
MFEQRSTHGGGTWSRTGAVLTLVAVVGVATACSSSDNGSSSSGGGTPGAVNLTIGMPDDFTGANAFAGVEQQQAAQLAVTDANKKYPGVHVSLKTADTQSSPTAGVSAVQRLLSDSSVNAIVGIAFTQTAQATMPLMAQDGRPAIMLQVTDLTGGGNNVFSMSPPPAGEQKALVADGLTPANVKSVGIIYQDQPTLNADRTALKTALSGAGMNVIGEQGTALTTTDFSPQITSVLGKHPDAIGIFAIPPATGTIVSQLRQQGFTGVLFGHEGDASTAFTKVAGKSADKFVLATRWNSATATGDGKTFVDEFKAAYPDAGAPDQFGVAAYDAVLMLTQAANKSKSNDKAALVNQLKSGQFATAESPTLQFGSDNFIKVNGVVVKYNAAGESEPAS